MTCANGRRGMLAGHGCYKRGEKTPASSSSMPQYAMEMNAIGLPKLA
jgi:hypothetical protein